MDLRKKPESSMIGARAPSANEPRPSVGLYLFVKLAPFLTYLLCGNFVGDSNVVLVLFLVAAALEFWVVKGVCAWEMIGITWVVEPDNDGGIVKYVSKPAPFVPFLAIANLFWIGASVSVVFWLIILVAGPIVATRRLLHFILALLGLSAQVINAVLLKNGHDQAQKETADIARSAMVDGSIEFALVRDEEEDEIV